MESFLRDILQSKAVADFFRHNAWAWPLNEVVHFVGLSLLVGIVAIFDLRLLGVAKNLPVAPLRRLLPWAVLGFVLAVTSGLMFVEGIEANISIHPYVVLVNDVWLQLKLLFIFLAGVNLFAFYITGMSGQVDKLGPGDDAPLLAKLIAGTSLFLWIGVMYFGRLIPFGQFSPP
jgi:hypothetical protein